MLQQFASWSSRKKDASLHRRQVDEKPSLYSTVVVSCVALKAAAFVGRFCFDRIALEKIACLDQSIKEVVDTAKRRMRTSWYRQVAKEIDNRIRKRSDCLGFDANARKKELLRTKECRKQLHPLGSHS